MRKQNSLFDRYCCFINQAGTGNTYTSTQLNDCVGKFESSTQWKRWSKNQYYTTRGYQSQLRQAGIIRMIRRGQWEILMTIPDWFTLAHLQTLCGNAHTDRRQLGSDGQMEYIRVARCEMSKEEILAKLQDFTDILAKLQETFDEPKAMLQATKLAKLGKALSTAYNSTYQPPADLFCKTTTWDGQDPLYYASGTYAQQREEPAPTATVEKIDAQDSTFYQAPDQWKYGQQLQENLMINSGYINSALAIMDQADFLDPVMHARVLNIMAQLKDLARTIDERIEYKQTKPII